MNCSVIIGFSRSKLMLSRLICLFTNSTVSHTYVKVATGYSNPVYVVYQASGLTVNAENYDHFLSHAEVIDEIQVAVSDEKWDDTCAFLLKELGKPYSCKQLLGMLWVLICRRFGRRVKNPFRDGEHSYICVELVAKLLGVTDAEEMTPQDLLELLQAHQVEI